MTFGQRLRQIRQQQNKSQKSIEVVTGIPQTTISGWETGISEPQVTDLKKLAAALGVSAADLLDDSLPA